MPRELRELQELQICYFSRVSTRFLYNILFIKNKNKKEFGYKTKKYCFWYYFNKKYSKFVFIINKKKLNRWIA